MVGGTIGRKSVRACKNVTKGYSPTQKKVRSSTSNDPEPPNTRDLNEIASLSHNNADFVEIMEMLDKRLNDRGKNWRHVFKALTVLEYLLLYGSEIVFKYCEDNLYEIKTLREFQYIDDNGIDQGMNVRQVAKDITNLVLNPQTLRQRRRKGGVSDDERRRDVRDVPRPREQGGQRKPNHEDKDLQRAIELSKLEEEKRQAAIAKANSNVFNFEEAQKELEKKKAEDNPLIDLSDLTIAPTPALQVQYTAVQPQYTQFQVPAQYTSLQPQFTAIEPQYTQFQYAYGDPYEVQRQQEAMQAEYLRQQAEWAAQQQAQAYQAQQQAEDLYRQQLLYQQQPQIVQPTGVSIGSNNPFAQSQTPVPTSPSPSLTVSSAPSSASSFSPSTPYSARSLSRATNVSSFADERHSALASLYATRTGPGDDGVDTFGNTGFLRYGPTDTGRVAAQKTGALHPQLTTHSMY